MPKLESLAQLGRRIREMRESRGLTQEQFGFASGLDRTYISDLERGNRNPSYLGLRKLARGLSTSLSEMLEGLDEAQNGRNRGR